MADNKKNLDTCGCCGKEPEKPAIYNRPGLPALNYRIANHGRFLERMMSNIPGQTIPSESIPDKTSRPLSYLTTRATDDPSIALMDAWAAVLDVLTFYQERIANEGFLRTTTERRSILELARSIGYELKPGVAASTHLAFTVEDRDDPFRVTTVPRGTQVMSIPGKGELPQVFETIEDIEARAEWNKLKPRMHLTQNLAIRRDDGKLYFIDVNSIFSYTDGSAKEDINNKADFYFVTNGLQAKVDDAIKKNYPVFAVEVQYIYIKGIDANLKSGGIILVVGKTQKDGNNELKAQPFYIKNIHLDTKHKITKITIGEPSQDIPQPKREFNREVLGKGKPGKGRVEFSKYNVDEKIMNSGWAQSDFEVMINMNDWDRKEIKQTLKTEPEIKLGEAETGIFALRQKVGFFGHNAPFYCSVPGLKDTKREDIYPVNWDNAGNEGCTGINGTGPISIWEDPNIKKTNSGDYHYYSSHHVYLERDVSGILTESYVVFDSAAVGQRMVYRVGRADETSMTGFALAGKAIGLILSPVNKKTTLENSDKSREFKVRETSAYVQSEALSIAELPLEDDIEAGTEELMIDELVFDLKVGQKVIISGERLDAPGVPASEIRALKEITHYGGYTVLEFEEGLKYGYVRKTVAVNANVAEATHGETVEEVLGSGDSSLTHQGFILKKPPLTYVKATTPGGSKSTLSVRVNGVQWKEVSSFYDTNAEEQGYIVRINNEAVPTITFGNGVQGMRLPTGNLNVSAVYRSGIGLKGEVEAGSLTLLKIRPPGIASVINPQAASGAEEPESLDRARSNAPLTVRTLERIVSLRDYEDFANSFVGVGKAQAVSIWTGESYIVHVTVASAGGKEVNDDDKENLRDAINLVRDPAAEFKLESFKQVYFNLTANISFDGRYTPADVKAKIRSSLNEEFSFQRRSFGQPVTAAEIVTLIQGIVDVIYVDIDDLYIVTDNDSQISIASLSSVLPCSIARWNEEEKRFEPAELLLINPTGIILSQITNE